MLSFIYMFNKIYYLIYLYLHGANIGVTLCNLIPRFHKVIPYLTA